MHRTQRQIQNLHHPEFIQDYISNELKMGIEGWAHWLPPAILQFTSTGLAYPKRSLLRHLITYGD